MSQSDEPAPKYVRTTLVLMLVAAFLLSVLLFEALFFSMGYNYFSPPIAINLKLHEANKKFTVSPSSMVKKLSNKTLEHGEFEIEVGPSNEILAEEKCQASDLLIYAIGSSTTEQKFVSSGRRWVDQLNLRLNQASKGYCVQNFGYGGVNLNHIADTHYFLLSRQIPSAVIFMSNATDIGQLMRYGTYKSAGNHYSKQRIVINGQIKRRDGYFPGLNTVVEKFLNVQSKNQADELDRTLSPDQIVGAYTEKLETIAKYSSALGVPFIYLIEPRLNDLSVIAPQKRQMIVNHYKSSDVDYSEMSEIHQKISAEVKTLEGELLDCVIDTSAFNNPQMLYDEGHLNVEGSELFADLIFKRISAGGECALD